MAASLVLTGCPGTLDDPGRFEVDAGVETGSTADAEQCPDIPTMLSKTCGGAGCHSTAEKMQGLDLQSANVTSRLVCVSATGGGLLVDPSTPSQSVLYTKLSSSPPFGARMPSGAPPFDDATRACVLAWISGLQAGAGSCGRANSADAGGDGKTTSDASADAAASD